MSCYTGKTHRKKESYTKQSAFRKSQEIQSEGGPYLRPYECPKCGSYHLTSQKRRKS